MATSTLKRNTATAGTNGHVEAIGYDDIAFRIPADALQLEGFRAWTLSDDFPEQGRIAFIAGEVFVDMSWEAISSHNLVKSQIGSVLTQIADRDELGMTLIDGCRLVNVAGDVSNVPDVTFVSFAAIEAGRVTFPPAKTIPGEGIELVGSPDVVVEVVSRSSVSKDTVKLRTAYHKAEIPEYWLIDARGEEIVFQILMHRRSGYAASPSRDGWIRSRVFDREFRLVRKKNRVGILEYRLEVRSDGSRK